MTAKLTEAGFWRKNADSSQRCEPRVLIRVFVDEGEIDHAIAFYEKLHDTQADMRFDFPEHRLVLAAVGPFLILEGSEENLNPFRSTVGTLLVDDIFPTTNGCEMPAPRYFSARWRCPPVPVSTPACRTAPSSNTYITGRAAGSKPVRKPPVAWRGDTNPYTG